jgi:hypothetical protein
MDFMSVLALAIKGLKTMYSNKIKKPKEPPLTITKRVFGSF